MIHWNLELHNVAELLAGDGWVVARSWDGGETFAEMGVDEALIDPNCQGSMLFIGGRAPSRPLEMVFGHDGAWPSKDCFSAIRRCEIPR